MANCKTCKNVDVEKSLEPVPYIVHESVVARFERQAKRLWIALVIAVVMVFASNAIWLYAWMQYDYSSESIIVEQDAQDGGNANYIGNDGDIMNGVSEGNNP